MNRRGVAVVEFPECPDRPASSHIHLIRKSERLGFNFSDQAFDQAPQINSIAPTLIEGQCACSEIDRHRDRYRTDHRRMRAGFAKILKSQVPSETEPNQRDP